MNRPILLLSGALILMLSGCERTTGRTEGIGDTAALSDSTPTDTTVTDVTATEDTNGRSASLLSAFFGLDDALPQTSDRAICEGAAGKDGMPVAFSHEIDVATMQAGDFRVTAHSGKAGDITCVTLAPADGPGEARTVLVVGQFGGSADEPATVEVTGDLLSKDNLLNFSGAKASVIPLGEGPTLSLAEVVPRDEWDLGRTPTRRAFGGGSGCPIGTVQVVRSTWTEGVTKPGGEEIDDIERVNYRVTIRGVDGEESNVVPFAIGDLGDGDNNHELCLDHSGEPLVVQFAAGLLTDPREDLNPLTQIAVTHE